MRPLRVVWIGLALCGCAGPIGMQVAVAPEAAATVRLHKIAGDPEAPANGSCTAPCSLNVYPRAHYQISVDAPGYYPAEMGVEYPAVEVMSHIFGKGGMEADLVVPLVPASSAQHRAPATHEPGHEPRKEETTP